MRRYLGPIAVLAAVTVLLMLIYPSSKSAQHLYAAADTESPFCFMPPDSGSTWLPTTPAPHETNIPTPRDASGDTSDCQFYRPAWQRFLVATQPTLDGPTFLSYPSFDQIFPRLPSAGAQVTSPEPTRLSLRPRSIQRPNDPNTQQEKFLDQTQAGIGGALGGSLIDQHGRFIYYAINVDPSFLSFLSRKNLTTPTGLANIDPTLTFPTGDKDPTGVVEFKSAWMIVKNKKSAPTYFVAPAKVPHYVVENGLLVPKMGPKGQPVFDDVWVALIALHVVFTLPGHPEMIWSTFEHVHLDSSGKAIRDNAPAAPFNPSKTPSDTIISKDNFPLYKAGTTVANANKPIDGKLMAQGWDSRKQSFTKGGTVLQTSVYRPYPGSKSDKDPVEDSEVIQINDNATRMFNDAKARKLITDSDERQNYRLVGAVWLDDPLLPPSPSFKVKQTFVNPIDQSTDDHDSVLAGEGRLGSTAMESFTEFEEGSPNCFSCHDTRAVKGKQGGQLLPPTLLNVSHVLSKSKDTLTVVSK
jgi:hypothetical protein